MNPQVMKAMCVPGSFTSSVGALQETSKRGMKIAELFSSHTQLTDSHKPLEDLCKELCQSMSRESDELMTKLLHGCHLHKRGTHKGPLPDLQCDLDANL